MFGLDAYVLDPPVSLILSIFLVLGCDGIGFYISPVFGLHPLEAKWVRYQSPVIGAMTLSVLLYPVTLLGYGHLSVFQPLAFLLVAFSFVHLWMMTARRIAKKKKENAFLAKFDLNLIWTLLPVLLVVSLGIYTFSPITNADSLDYHVGVALHILRTGSFPVTPEWYTSRLAGSGEVLNALGLAIGSEQFGAILQFVGLLGIVGLVYHAESEDSKFQEEWKTILTLAVASAPVLIFLIGSVKPQVLPISMTTLALAITVFPSRRNLDVWSQKRGFFLACLLVMTASQAKFSYLLGGGVVGIISMFIMLRKKQAFSAVVIATLSCVIVLAPPVIWKHLNFGGNIVEAFLTPFPGGWPGTGMFEAHIRSYIGNPLVFPLFLIVPASIGYLSNVIGIGPLLFLFLRPKRDIWAWGLVFPAIVVFIVSAVLGPKVSRSYLEPYFWLLLALALQKVPQGFFRYRNWLKIPAIMQVMLVMAMCWYGILTAVPGAFVKSARTNVMMRMANGYDVMKWVGDTLPENAVILTGHRAVGLSPREMVQLDWLSYVLAGRDDPLSYLARIKTRKVTHMVVIGDDFKNSSTYRLFSSCLSDEIIGPGKGHQATRNPFNQGKEFTLWAIKFHSELLPDCFMKPPERLN